MEKPKGGRGKTRSDSDQVRVRAAKATGKHPDTLSKAKQVVEAVEIEPVFAEEAKKRQGQRTDLYPDNIVATLPQSKARERAAEICGVSPRNVQKANQFEISRRREKLPFSFHAEVAGLKQDRY